MAVERGDSLAEVRLVIMEDSPWFGGHGDREIWVGSGILTGINGIGKI
jgi:hypothetical protein